MSSIAPERSCPVCMNERGEEIFSLSYPVPDNFALANYQIIILCERCHALYSSSKSAQSDYDKYYRSLVKYGSQEISYGPLEKERFSLTAKLLSSYFSKESPILDVGCGGGGLLTCLGQQGFKDLSGVDGCDLQASPYFHFFRGELSSFSPLLPKKYKGILCSGVFEHVYDLKSFILQIRSALTEDGLLFIQVPDASRYRENIVSPFQDFNLEHINHFSRVSLSNLVEMNGLEIISISTDEIPQTENYKMPVINLIAKKGVVSRKEIIPDEEMARSIRSYIETSEKLLMAFERGLEKECTGQDEVYLWGAGQLALKLCNFSLFRKIKIKSILDRSPSVPKICGIQVLSGVEKIEEHIPIIIGSVLYESSIRKDIESRGLKNRVISLRKE